MAAELGCPFTYAVVTGLKLTILTRNKIQFTGKYSQRIFEKLEHTTIKRVMYDDFRDENGELYLKDTREHTSIITCYKKLI